MASAGIITAPAVALMIAGVWKIFSAILGMLALSGMNAWMGDFLGMGNLLGNWGSVAIFSVVLFKVVPGLLMIFGGYQMLHRQSYAWALAAGIVAIVACSLIGLPVGIWTLIVLARDDVKSAFGAAPASAPGTHQPDHSGMKFVLLAGVVLILFFVTVIVVAATLFVGKSKVSAGGGWPKLMAGLPGDSVEFTTQHAGDAALRRENGEYWTNFSETFPLNADGRFSIDNVNGMTQIHGWSSNVVVVTTAIHGKTVESVEAVKVKISSDTNYVSVHTEVPSNSGFSSFWDWFKHGMNDTATVDYTVQVPEQAELDGVSSVNGRLEIRGVTGSISASTVNGEAKIKDASHDLKLNTVNGSINAEMNSLGSGQSVSFNTVNGAVTLTLPANSDASFSLSTLNGGISSEFPELHPKKEFPIGSKLKDSLGSGGASVKGETVNGGIEIVKGTAPPTITNALPSTTAK